MELHTKAFGHYSNIIYTLNYSAGSYMNVATVGTNGQQRIFSNILTLHSSELGLMDGRFWNFDREVRSNPIMIDMHPDHGDYSDLLKLGMSRAIEWIAENCLSPWSFHLTPGSIVTLFFDNLEDAVLFRLSLQGRTLDPRL